MSRKYVVLNSDEISSIVFNDVIETSVDTLRRSINGKTFVKFEGDTPSWLEGKPTLTNAEICAILDVPDGEWQIDPFS